VRPGASTRSLYCPAAALTVTVVDAAGPRKAR
jgi:hypothetical protein